MTHSPVTRRRSWFHLTFEHFDVISVVYKSIDHGKLLSIFLTIRLTVSELIFAELFSENRALIGRALVEKSTTTDQGNDVMVVRTRMRI